MAAKKQQPESDLPPKLGAPAMRALTAAGCTSLEQLITHTEAEIKALHGIGPNAVQKLRAALDAKGLHYAGE